MQNLPRIIDPSLIVVGDTISVMHPDDLGIMYSMEGKVAVLHVNTRGTNFVTKEGGILLTWRVGDRTKIKVWLLKRPPMEQTPMFGMDEIRERIV
jgi:hypothetical protein